MGLFDLIQQNHRIGLAPHGFGQHAAFAIADITRRRAFQAADRVGLLVFGHVDGDDVLLTAIKHLGQRQRGFRLTHTRGPGQHEHANRLGGVIQPRPAGLDALGDHLHRMVLTDDALGQMFIQMQHGVDLVLEHPPHRNSRPVAHHGGHGLRIHNRQDQRGLALHPRQFRILGLQLRQNFGPLFGCQRVLGTLRIGAIHRGAALAQLGAQSDDLIHNGFFGLPTGGQTGQPRLFLGLGMGHGLAALAHIIAGGFIASDNLQLRLQR